MKAWKAFRMSALLCAGLWACAGAVLAQPAAMPAYRWARANTLRRYRSWSQTGRLTRTAKSAAEGTYPVRRLTRGVVVAAADLEGLSLTSGLQVASE